MILFILDISNNPGNGDLFISKLFINQKTPIIAVLNKTDLIDKEIISKRINSYKETLDGQYMDFHLCSAANQCGCEELVNLIINNLPSGPKYYPDNIKSDQPQYLLISELIREQVLRNTREEIPHSVAVSVDKIEEVKEGKSNSSRKKLTAIRATIIVEKKSQKGILIGKGGNMIKTIGVSSRQQIQLILDNSIHLELFVKVVPNWRSKASKLNEFGYMKD